MEYAKAKSVAKQVWTKSPALDKLVRDTLRTISEVVGATLGPGGQPVLIERYENDLPASVTKDGVTVFRSLGFESPAAHCIMETARDASIRTAMEAGDGTTTATILSEALVRKLQDYCVNHPRVSPQKVVRHMERVFRDYVTPTVKKLSRAVSLEDDDGRKLCHAVASISANGDTALADATIECFLQTGDEGNVTIIEATGPSRYEVELIQGFPIGMGYEASAGKMSTAFINDPATQRVLMEKPIFLLYNGKITEIQTLIVLLAKVWMDWEETKRSHNVVVCATGFSDMVIANLAVNFPMEDTSNVFPLVAPMTPQTNSQLQFLHDLQAVTGAKILDPATAPIEHATIDDLGPGVEGFECTRFRSNVIGYADETLLGIRVDQLKQQLVSPESEVDAILTRERIAKLAGGIAKLIVYGSSSGELKEKRDRADDAVCAVRGAIKHGCLPGGAWTLIRLVAGLEDGEIENEILAPAFMAPFERLMSNCGIITPEERDATKAPIVENVERDFLRSVRSEKTEIGTPIVYDFLNHQHVNAYETGILDSTPAVLEAIRTSISVATTLGTLSGIVVFGRDRQLEMSEAKAAANWERTAAEVEERL